MNYQRIKKIEKAFDRRNPDPSKNYGIHGAEIRFALKGKDGAITWVLFTSRQLPHITKEVIQNNRIEIPENIIPTLLKYSGDFKDGEEINQVIEYGKYLQQTGFDKEIVSCIFRPMGADLGYHSPKPMYDGHKPCRVTLKKMKFKDGEITPGTYGDPIICEYLDNDVPCYYDGSMLAGQKMYNTLLEKGEEEIWKQLEEYYTSTFEKVDTNAK